ncbi:LuxR family transcriptional regulator [Myroides odoratimimus subsp. xuanwuensis]
MRALLADGTAVALHGPTGIGKSALLDALEAAPSAPGALPPARVLRIGCVAAEHAMPYVALQDLLDRLSPADLGPVMADLPEQIREQAARGVVGLEPSPAVRAGLARACRSLLERLATTGGALLLLDDAQWLDRESAEALGYAVRRVSRGLALAVTVGGPVSGPSSGDRLDLPGLQHLEVPPLEPADLVELLGRHGLPAHRAQRLHTESGGLPSLALALCGALSDSPSVLGGPSPVPASITRVLRDRLRAQPDDVAETLLLAALLHRPTVRQLVRAGRPDAADHVDAAVRAGLVARAGEQLRFTPAAQRQVVVESVPASRRTELHRQLADVATTSGERARHLALATSRPDPELAAELHRVATATLADGARELATELLVLAADRCPLAMASERVEWLASAIETGVPGNHTELVHRALGDFLEAPASPTQRVRVRLALLELADTGLAVMDEALTAALVEAGDDERLVAEVLLQRARVQLIESRPVEAGHNAAEGIRLLRRAGDLPAVALALPILAVTTRWTGRPAEGRDHDDLLTEALALPLGTGSVPVHLTPAYMAARFAFYDDRLDEAWSAFGSMLAVVERGAGPDRVHVLRSLVEVGVRRGHCREAMAHAARAAAIGEEFDLDPHTSWFVSATAELAGGDLERGRMLAERGVAVAEERRDTRYLQRHLVLLGQALLRGGEAARAVTVLRRLQGIERGHAISDPTINRWQADLVSALVATGDHTGAGAVLAEARRALDGRTGTDGVAAQLDRAEAELLGAGGDVAGGLALLDRAQKALTDCEMRVDLGRALLTRAHLERRRRRAAAARAALEEARALFEAIGAAPWARQAEAELRPGVTAAPPGVVPLLAERLTPTEARIARAVTEGATNREIAERAFVSVKTVEATLTRIYRKLDVRSRTQLATLLVPPAEG